MTCEVHKKEKASKAKIPMVFPSEHEEGSVEHAKVTLEVNINLEVVYKAYLESLERTWCT